MLARRFLIAAGSLALMAAPALAQKKDPGISAKPAATLTMVAKGAAVGIGYTWGDGTLRYAGKSYPFSINGVSIADVGFSEVRGTGRVYNLKKVQDFSGTYVAATGEATLVNGIGGRVLRNANGVEIRIDEATKGARLQGSADGIQLTLK